MTFSVFCCLSSLVELKSSSEESSWGEESSSHLLRDLRWAFDECFLEGKVYKWKSFTDNIDALIAVKSSSGAVGSLAAAASAMQLG